MGLAEPVGTLDTALQHAARLLESDPAAAVEQAAEILKAVPSEPHATLMMGVALRKNGALAKALATLTALTATHSDWASAYLELGLTAALTGEGKAALTALRHAVKLQPDLSAAWIALGDHLNGIGDVEGADSAYVQHLKFSTRDPRLMSAASALFENRIPEAESLLREHLKQSPTDVAAIRMFAELAARIGRYVDAEALLARCLELAPSFTAARHNYAVVLHRQYKSAEALRETDRLLALDARNPGYRNLKAAILGRSTRRLEAARRGLHRQ